MIHIKLNGEDKKLESELTVSELLNELQLDKRKLAVEHNRTILAKSSYEETPVNDGDQIEIVAFIGGG